MFENAIHRLPRLRSLALIALVALFAGCGGTKTIAIRDMLDDPASYNNKDVRVAGEVTENIGLLGVGAYRVDDGTGTITVVTKEGGAPRKGAKIGLLGRFRSAFTLGANNAAVIMESKRYKP
jgi:hypothetical protein